jgi:formylglycine-generating enzyme required for sulfatase activity
MPHAVFISHSSTDKITADAVCAVLERNGLACWIAPRDVVPGAVWGSSIVDAIHSAKVMVLVFTGAADSSPQIQREVERAISKGLVVIPFRIEDVQPSGSMEYFISSSHWMDAFSEPLEQHLEALARVIRSVLEAKTGEVSGEVGGVVPQADQRAAVGPTTAIPHSAARISPVSPAPVGSADGSAPHGQSAPTSSSRRFVIVIAAAVGVGAVLVGLLLTWSPLRSFIAAQQVPQVGKIFTDCVKCPEMVVVPAGHFRMGASEQETSIFDWSRPLEQPVHEVRIEKPFAVGRFPITRDEFEQFVKETNTSFDSGCTFWNGNEESVDPTRSFRDPKLRGGAQGGDHPVVCVSFQNAEKFVAWLSNETGKPYRLLSDSEREYVTRAGTTTAFWWGPAITPDQANYWSDVSYKGSPTTPARWTTVPVKFFQPNPWGLYQVHGNVTEFVEDCWHPDYSGAPSDGSAWGRGSPGDCGRHTIRGGAFINGADLLRSARRANTSELGSISVGFRVALTLTP